uniref:Nuclear envelope integral membrane protein 1 n=1 Tax=Caenorhabditis japonica TaxID=281687 RepID=A0A8R1DQG8_CAEJA
MRILTSFSLLLAASHAFQFDDCAEKPGALTRAHHVAGKLYSGNLDFYHQKALPYNPIYAFTDVILQINLTDGDSYQFYQGSNCSTVQQLYDNDNRYFGLLRKAALLRSHQLNPFNDTIVGVATTEPYQISVLIWKVNYVRVGVYVVAILLFLLASKLVRNIIFYYTSGCSFGLLASLLLVAFIVWRVAPKKTIGVPILIGGWSVSIYMLHFAWNNLQSIMLEYQKYVIGYFAAVLLISLAVCYKRGPPTDARSHDIAQWTLQLIALTLIYFSVQIIEVTIGTTAALVLQQITRGFLLSGIRWYFVGLFAFWKKLFPPKRRFLNEEEYEELGEKTTKEQLAQLREYCKKEGSRPWKLAGNVRSARRLARFVEGEDEHVTEDEMYAHEISADVLDRYEDDDDQFFQQRTPNRRNFYEDDGEEEEEEEEEWDEIVVKRRASDYGRGSVQSVRVPRSVSARLLSPYQSLNRTIGAGVGYHRENSRNNRVTSSYYSEHRPRGYRAEDERQSRGRRFEYEVQNSLIEPSISSSNSSSSGMTPSEYMRRARRADAVSKTPTRRFPPTDTEEVAADE